MRKKHCVGILIVGRAEGLLRLKREIEAMRKTYYT